MEEPRRDWSFELDGGRVQATETAPGQWAVSWYPPTGHPDYPGSTLGNAELLSAGFPFDGDDAAIEAWVRQYPWEVD